MKLGIIGTGAIVRELLPLLRGCGYTPTALCGTPRSRAVVEELCRAHEIREGFCDPAEMLRRGDMDAVYVAVPNDLHFSLAKLALEAGRHVIVEKPMTGNHREATELAELAKERSVCLFEAVSTLYLPNYRKLRELLPRIGAVKIVSCNFSQYSRRYDAFRRGEILPAFDPARAGGALMDLNLYNLHYLMGLFGEPQAVRYHANLERGIDTSGVLVLDYGGFRAVSVAAKDCSAPADYVIQGTEGYLQQNSPANVCGPVTLHLNDGTEERFDEAPGSRLEPEFRSFRRAMEEKDLAFCYEMLERSLAVSRVQTAARMDAGLYFPADNIP